MHCEVAPKILSKKIDYSAIFAREIGVYKNYNVYHKFTFLNGNLFSREQVLRAIVVQVLPNYLLPFKYETEENGDSHFLATNCGNAIRALVNNNLMVTIQELNVQVEVQIHLDYISGLELKVVPTDIINCAIKRCTSYGDNSNVTMDVSNFETDKDLKRLYFPLWVPVFQRIIVQAAQNVCHLKHLNLSHNKISSLIELARLFCPHLEELNLSYNEITWSDLAPIMPDRIKSLWLEGNPLCAKPLSEYVQSVKAQYPFLYKLDGVTIYPEVDMAFVMRNSFVNLSCHSLVDQFLHHYFNWLSRSEERNLMVHMYHPNAALSLSCNFNTNTADSIYMFQYISRNVLKITNYVKAVDCFKTGSTHVSFTLSTFPFVEVDLATTTVDIPYYLENQALQICMNGIFRDKQRKMYWMGFTFLLQANPESNLGEWKITNQMISITQATEEQKKTAFGEGMKELDRFEFSREDMLSEFKELTSLNTVWSKYFLNTAQWDFESALQSFVDQFKGDLVPDVAFIES